uniref:Uncharacterized protein n=1 Tax=Populus alba TaxID=43335 RepID=A0A4U5Q036_POPAL|nr:hypothetical protein D5086_0000160060 [Populus alba]
MLSSHGADSLRSASDVNPCASSSDHSPLSPSKLSPSCLDVLPTIIEISSGSKLVDTITIENCSEDEALVAMLLEEEQQDFSFSNDDCGDGSPLSSPPAAPTLPLVPTGGSPQNTPSKASPPASGSRVWWDLFSSDLPSSHYTKL